MASNDNSHTYLMGRLYSRDGVATSRYYPMPYETLALQKEEGKSEYEHSNHYPLIASGANGELSNLSDMANKTGELVRTPLALSAVKKKGQDGSVSQKMLFFPSYLVPMAQVSYQTADSNDWMKGLYTSLEAYTKNDDCAVQLKLRSVSVAENCLLLPDDKLTAEHLEKNTYFKNYRKWLSNYKPSHVTLIEVPQFYTIQVYFSSELFVDAHITLSDFSETLAISGNMKGQASAHPVSTVERVSVKYYTAEAEEKNTTSYVATFWIESENVLTLSELDQYCRIDVSFEHFDEDLLDSVESKGIPSKYSLTEKALALLIHTSAGRTSVVNGDPISVEEALINHAPQHYQHLVKTFTKQPYGDPSVLAMETQNGAPTIPAQVWSLLQNNKSLLEVTAGSLEKGLSWLMLAKVTAAASSGVKDSGSEDIRDIATVVAQVTGITVAVAGVMGTLNKMHDRCNNSLTTLGHNATNAFNTLVFGEHVSLQTAVITHLNQLPGVNINLDAFRSFLDGAGKLGGVLLDKPLSVLEIAYGFNQSMIAHEDADKAYAGLFETTQKYSLSTLSVSKERLQDAGIFHGTEEDITNQQEVYNQAIDSMRKKLSALVVEEQKHYIQEVGFSEFRLQLNATMFDFDSHKMSDDSTPFQSIAEELKKLSGAPFVIMIIGHTCSIGSEAYNLELSKQRAVTVKNSIIDALSDEQDKSIWSDLLVVKGEGESTPLPGNNNETEEERKLNRRVEIVFVFSSSVEYPACRSGLIMLEKAAKLNILKAMKANDTTIGAINTSLDAVLGGAASAFPPAGGLLAAKQMASIAMDIDALFDDKNEAKFAAEMTSLRYQDVMAIQEYLVSSEGNSIFKVHLSAYLKRMMAFNGLLRLINFCQLDKAQQKSKQLSGGVFEATSNLAAENKTPTKFEDLNVRGYIEKYIINDDWDIDISLLGVEHLDEQWLEKNGYDANINNKFSAPMSMAEALIVGSHTHHNWTSDKQAGKSRPKASQFQNYFPVHYIASEDDRHFESLVVEAIPFDLDKSIFTRIEVFVRRPYKLKKDDCPSKDNWVPFKKYYKTNKYSLTPFDNIRVIALLDSDKVKGKNGNFTAFPVTLNVKSLSNNEGTWAFFDSVASTHTEYARYLEPNEFSTDERELIWEGENESLIGVVIEPSYYFGKQKVFGIRPIADYDSSIMKSLFDSAEKSTVSGGSHYLSYYLELFVEGRKKTELELPLNDTVYGTKVTTFNVTLSPSRRYQFTKDFQTFGPEKHADGDFYDESFLKSPKKQVNKITSLKLFDKPEATIYLTQQDSKIDRLSDDKDKKDPLVKRNNALLRGNIELFDWNKSSSITLLIRSKHVKINETSWSEAKLDSNKIDINVDLSIENGFFSTVTRKLGEIKSVYRLGMIVRKDGQYTFNKVKNLKEEALPPSLQDFIKQIESLVSDELKELALDSSYLLGKEEKTDIFVAVEKLKYINFFGYEVDGLMPMLASRDGLLTPSFNAVINGPEGSDLSGCDSNTIYLNNSAPKAIPSNWLLLIDKEKEVSKAVELNKLQGDQTVSEFKKLQKTAHMPSYNLQQWIKAGNGSYRTTNLNDEHRELIEEWVG
ncbi:OmpA family protein [Aliivibrio fischeri]|uniref:OmpA family protein n=1 Tax=Aliivibrio fischeri TaxID=668 RepID=UPI0007C5D974|nr:OmpA family protein [Aliivibrio fischeri]